MFFPRVDAKRFLDTGQRSDLERIQQDQDGVLLTATTLGETLRANGKKMLAVGSGTTGAVFLLNHTVSGGAILHTDYALPAPLHERMLAELGPPPAEGHPNDARNSRAVNAFLKIGLPSVDPAVTVMWLSDPDTTAHALGMGHPTTIEALRRLDREVLNIQEGLRAAGLFDVYNIWVTSDHGFATYTGAPDVRALLKPFAGTLSDGSPRIVHGETAIYVRDGDRQIVRRSSARCSRRLASGPSSPGPIVADRWSARWRGPCRSTSRAEATRGRATFSILPTGPTPRTHTALPARVHPMALPGTAAPARLRFTTR